MIDIKIIRTEKLITTEAWKHTFVAAVELFDNNCLISSYGHISYDSEGILAYVDDKLAGFMSFEREKWNNSISIGLAYVLPEYRLKGVHSAMFKDLVDFTKSINFSYITTGTHVNNKEAQAAFEAQGRVLTILRYHYTVGN